MMNTEFCVSETQEFLKINNSCCLPTEAINIVIMYCTVSLYWLIWNYGTLIVFYITVIPYVSLHFFFLYQRAL